MAAAVSPLAASATVLAHSARSRSMLARGGPRTESFSPSASLTSVPDSGRADQVLLEIAVTQVERGRLGEPPQLAALVDGREGGNSLAGEAAECHR